jgi:hypothetical protein
LKYSVHYIPVTEQIKIKFGLIINVMAEAVGCVVEKLIFYLTFVEEKRNSHRILVEKCEGMR